MGEIGNRGGRRGNETGNEIGKGSLWKGGNGREGREIVMGWGEREREWGSRER